MAVRWGRAVFQVQQRPGTEGVGRASGTGAVRWDTPTGGSSLQLPRLAGWGRRPVERRDRGGLGLTTWRGRHPGVRGALRKEVVTRCTRLRGAPSARVSSS